MKIKLALSITALLLSGCSMFGSDTKPAVPVASMQQDNYVPGYNEKRAPFTLEVIDELNDGERLLVMLRLTPQVRWNADNVVVKLNALKDGKVVASKDHCIYSPCSERLENKKRPVWLEASVSREFTIPLTAAEITDYQVELFWGDEARAYRDSAFLMQTLASPTLRSISSEREVGQCAEDSCEFSYTVTANLQNPENIPLESVVLGAGFILDGEERTTLSIPENEEQLEVPDLHLRPGQSKTFEFVLEQDIPLEAQNRIKPVIRIVSYRYKQNS